MKGNEINNLLIKLSPHLPNLDDNERNDIDTKIDSIRKNWIELKNMIITRIDLIKLYIQFHQGAEQLNDDYMRFDDQIQRIKFNEMHLIDPLWNGIQNKFSFIKNIAQQFDDQSSKVCSPSLIPTDCASRCGLELTLVLMRVFWCSMALLAIAFSHPLRQTLAL